MKYFSHFLLRAGLMVAFLILLERCNSESKEYELIWEDGKAVAISIANASFNNIPQDDLPSQIQVVLRDSINTPMLGEFTRRGNKIIFEPIVPFTYGLSYQVIWMGKIIKEFEVPFNSESRNPHLSIFPSQDTLPENILKLYFQFSESMVESRSLRYVLLVNQKGDTLTNTFLDLQPELWNADGNILTIWFDPGRIKRDLIPNQKLGNPLISGAWYTLSVSDSWKSKSGLALDKVYSKSFFVGKRDETSPIVNQWNLELPVKSTKEALIILFHESLDFSLIQTAIELSGINGESVNGKIQLMQEEKGIIFSPTVAWQAGEYTLKVNSKLEDLAGNNLTRTFERDLLKDSIISEQKFFARKFTIR